MGLDNWVSLSPLRRAVKKVRFLLNFNINRFGLASIMGSKSQQRRLSFNNRSGLLEFIGDNEHGGDQESKPSRRREIQRTISHQSSVSEEDVDKKADMFISNFYRQLQMERQVSLELRYCRGDSLDSNRSY